MPRIHGTGVRPTGPQTFDTEVAPAPKRRELSAAAATWEKALAKNKLKDVPADQAAQLEAKFQRGSPKPENLAAGRVGASVNGLVVGGELFVRTKSVFPGAKPKWQSAGKLADAPAPKPEVKTDGGWSPKPKSLEARVQKALADRMGLLSNPEFQLKGSELTKLKKAIANGELEAVNATPKGLAGVGYTGYVSDGLLIVEKRAVRPGAASTFHLLGPL
ncbi:MAG: hypothetical protein ACOZQL_14520 [Myxococcota bacterium]